MKTQAKFMTSAANMKRAERFNLSHHGPANAAEFEQGAKRKRLKCAAMKLEISFGFDDCKLVPSLDLLKPMTTQNLADLPKTYRDLSSMKIPKNVHRSPSDVGDQVLYKRVINKFCRQRDIPEICRHHRSFLAIEK